jgi:alanine dehydrogenase
MNIGIPKETKLGEFRVALVPNHVRLLTQKGHTVFVEKDAGKKCKFSNKDYEKAGAIVVDDVYDSNMIVRVKEPALATIKENQIIMGYLHVEKGQHPILLKKLIDQNATSYAYEEIRDENGCRLVNLGVEAGIVGMYEGIRLYGKVLEKNGFDNRFKKLKPIKKYFCIEDVYKALREAKVHNNVNVYILGKGRVSSGAQEVLKYTDIKPNVLYRNDTRHMEKYLPEADIIINAVDWYPNEPRIITENMLKLMKKTAVIIDISCDENGAIESCIPTTWQKPTYIFNGVTHFCVDNLPSAVPRDSSIHLSSMIIDHVLKVANEKALTTGLMTKQGEFVYASIKDQSIIKKQIMESKIESIVYD